MLIHTKPSRDICSAVKLSLMIFLNVIIADI